jgi:ppGpp synthetase/RelA/SpoT-type nucleotidyltranferase
MVHKSKEDLLLKLEQEYNNLKPSLDRFREAISGQIQTFLSINSVQLGFPIQNRTKGWSSIHEKINSGKYNVKKSLTELQDLVGLRIILLFQRDVDRVCNLIETHLNIQRKYNTSERLKEDQLGYASFHYVVSIPEAWASVPSFIGSRDMIAEFQVRTLSQHTWAEASKLLQYKEEKNVPRTLLRSIGRVSALLETVDLEFERLLEERELYKKHLQELKPVILKKEKLNVDILEAILDKELPPSNKGDKEPYSDLVDELMEFDINDIDALIALIREQVDSILSMEQEFVDRYRQEVTNGSTKVSHRIKERVEKNVYVSHAGMLRTMLRQKSTDKFDQLFAKGAIAKTGRIKQ